MQPTVTLWGREITIEWRSPTAGLLEHQLRSGEGTTRICVWAPNSDTLSPRRRFIADVHLRHFGFLEAEGDTLQEAVDALAALMPAPPSKGGVA